MFVCKDPGDTKKNVSRLAFGGGKKFNFNSSNPQKYKSGITIFFRIFH